MTRLRASDRDRILENAYTTLARIKAYRQGLATLREAIDARIEDGLRAADYEGDGRGGGSGLTAPEQAAHRALLRQGDRAHDDLATLDAALVQLADADQAISLLVSRYPVFTGKPSEQKPGEGTCPVGSCANCWRFGRNEPRSDRYKDACDVCGRWKHDHGERMIQPLWRIRVEQGKPRITTGDLRRHAPHLLPKEQAS
jgi:hypothetical protein